MIAGWETTNTQEPAISRYKWIVAVLLAALFCTGLLRVGARTYVQLFDFVLCSLIVLQLFLCRSYFKFSKHSLGVLLVFAVVVAASCFENYSTEVALRSFGIIYLAGVALFSAHGLMPQMSLSDWSLAFASSALFQALVMVVGLVFLIFGAGAVMAWEFSDYPYFGHVWRWKGLTPSPNALVSVSAFVSVFLLVLKPRHYRTLVTILFLGSLVTLSKENICFMLVVLAVLLYGKISTKLLILTGVGGYALVLLLTLFYFCPDSRSCKQESPVVAPHIYQLGSVGIQSTVYLHLPRVASKNIVENPWTGIGLGNFRQTVIRAKQEGYYPNNLRAFREHDAYLGSTAQLGLGFPLLLLYVGLVFYRKLGAGAPGQASPMLVGSLAYLGYMIGESWLNGTLFFRHYWLNIGILAYSLDRYRKSYGSHE